MHAPRPGVPQLLFGFLFPNRHLIRKLMGEATIQDKESNSIATLKTLGQKARRESITEAYFKLDWLKRNYRNFEPSCW